MSTVADTSAVAAEDRDEPTNPWIGQAPSSPAGPVASLDGLRPAPRIEQAMALQTLRFSMRQIEFTPHPHWSGPIIIRPMAH